MFKVAIYLSRFLYYMALVSFLTTSVLPGYAQTVYFHQPRGSEPALTLPQPGARVPLSASRMPVLMKGVQINPDNPFQLDFIFDTGEAPSNDPDIRDSMRSSIKYFLAALTVPEKDIWVNLSPYEQARVIPQGFGLTEMGRDLLSQDYLLKQVTASLLYPEEKTGQEFWRKVYAEVYARYGTSDVPIDTFNKVWIVPDKADVYEHGNVAYILESHLKIMMEKDYLATKAHDAESGVEPSVSAREDANALTARIKKELLIPELEKEINEGEQFSRLRQIYNAQILAVWFKQALKESILNKLYSDKNKVVGINIDVAVDDI